VVLIDDWNDSSGRSEAKVIWKSTEKGNSYRLGYEGKVDIICKEPAPGPCYYPDHCHILVKMAKFGVGDKVKIEVDPDVLELLQEGHGGWTEDMALVSTRSA
jgi:hypothetical protein